MNETVQTLLALLLLAGCVGYVGLSAWRALRSRDGCGGSCGCGGNGPRPGPDPTTTRPPPFISRESLVRTTRRGGR